VIFKRLLFLMKYDIIREVSLWQSNKGGEKDMIYEIFIKSPVGLLHEMGTTSASSPGDAICLRADLGVEYATGVELPAGEWVAFAADSPELTAAQAWHRKIIKLSLSALA
jgi:hypothetical protein